MVAMKNLIHIIWISWLGISCQTNNTKNYSENLASGTSSSNTVDMVKRDLDAIKERDTLVALTGYNSVSYFVYRGEPMGYDYELLQRLSEHLGVNLKIQVVQDITQAENLLATGQGDILAHNLTITGKRLEKLAFTEAMNTTQQVLVQRKPKNWERLKKHQIDRAVLRTPQDLVNKTLHVREKSSYASRLKNLREETGLNFTITTAPGSTSTEYLIKQVALGEIDYTVADQNIASISQAFFPILDIKTPISLQQEVAWAMRPNAPKLEEAVNEWLTKMQGGSDYYVIYNRYFKHKRSLVRKVESELYARNSGVISEYDPLIKKYSNNLGWDWRLVAALIYQESKFDPAAKSWAGAKGLMQMMPATAKKFRVQNLYAPAANIKAGTAYLAELEDFWEDRIPNKKERKHFVMASYNVGPGHVLDAQRLAEKNDKDPSLWYKNVAHYLRKKSKPKYFNDPVVRHGYCRGEEPYRYVKQILNRYEHYKKFTDPIADASSVAML